ncbi:MAG TPA: hypothetical protein HA282_02010 [Nanoarchaeota archaeon]|nr:MAG: hypothetical protein QT01_C0002G0093 [archaeon GW2011_AR6]MBS3082685.1 hypothetical protein [Candidatus Pacearchaeota archaeon]HIH18213.1 hypothetical protein [Nanoarchaeota archaeon]HIH50915.1 hypothetical protein [Nanoarchaeota archaeon]HIH65970.1 hypothetical protein [Nanoarchaeota archaeon]
MDKQENYEEKAERFVGLLKVDTPIATLPGGVKIYGGNVANLGRTAEPFLRELNETLRETDITNGAKRFITKTVTSTVIFGIPTEDYLSTLEVFCIDTKDGKYGFFNPRNAEVVEKKMIEYYQGFLAHTPSDKIFDDESRTLYQWIEEFKEKYGHDPIKEK